jgi:hypothetical protein
MKHPLDVNAPAEPTIGSVSARRGSHERRRFVVNITPTERVGRILLGAAAIIAGGLLLVSAGTILSVSLEVLLVLAGLDLVITGALGHCPLYRKLGHMPSSLRRPV